MSELTFTPQPMTEDWRCAIANCRTLLGMKHTGGRLVIKHKDLHLEIDGAYDVGLICRRCGARNRVVATKLETLLRDADDAAE